MTREELIQSPEYWSEQYENECWRLGIKPDKVTFASTEINEEELDKLAKNYAVTEYQYDLKDEDVDVHCCIEDFKAGYRKAMEE